MLCRTASDLYWTSRHIERVDNSARLLDLSQRFALLPERLERGKSEAAAWIRALDSLGLSEPYAERHGNVTPEKVLEYIIFDPANPSSIRACLHAARESARAQRGAITGEMYEVLNATWLHMRSMSPEQMYAQGLSEFLDWLKRRSASFRGVTIGTMGRDEGYEFLRLGTFVERGDFALRFLGMHFTEHRRRENREARSAVEYYQFSALLHAMSAFETYRRIYRDTIEPVRVAELVLLREDMPRSLAVAMSAVEDVVQRLAGGARTEVGRQAGALSASIRFARIDQIFDGGMYAFIDSFISRLYRLTDEIVDQFMMSRDVIAN